MDVPAVSRILSSSTLLLGSVRLGNQLKIGPNPVKGYLRIQYGSSMQWLAISVMDINGRVLLTKSRVAGNDTNIDMSRLVAGVYVVKVRDTRTGEEMEVIVVKE